MLPCSLQRTAGLRPLLLGALRLKPSVCSGKNESEEKRELIFKEDGQGEPCF